jgi:hypothetical protein
MWSTFKAKFDSLENRAAGRIERLAQNPFLVGASARALTTFAQSKQTMDRAIAETLGIFGLATKRDQERLMHMVVELQSKLLDIEENLQTRALTIVQVTNSEANKAQPLPAQAEHTEPTPDERRENQVGRNLDRPVEIHSKNEEGENPNARHEQAQRRIIEANSNVQKNAKPPGNRSAKNEPNTTPNRRRGKRR